MQLCHCQLLNHMYILKPQCTHIQAEHPGQVRDSGAPPIPPSERNPHQQQPPPASHFQERVMACPICGMQNFQTQTDLAEHCAQCT